MINKTTFMANAQNVERKWVLIDAAGIPLGRLSSVVASILRGKTKPTYTPHADAGDFVIVINASQVVLTGKKATDKKYYRVSGYEGGLKSRTAGELLANNPVRLVETSVKGMLPHNTLGRAQGMKLHVYADDKHNQAAQKPEMLDISGLI